jgi:hypothetical protein
MFHGDVVDIHFVHYQSLYDSIDILKVKESTIRSNGNLAGLATTFNKGSIFSFCVHK